MKPNTLPLRNCETQFCVWFAKAIRISRISNRFETLNCSFKSFKCPLTLRCGPCPVRYRTQWTWWFSSWKSWWSTCSGPYETRTRTAAWRRTDRSCEGAQFSRRSVLTAKFDSASQLPEAGTFCCKVGRTQTYLAMPILLMCTKFKLHAALDGEKRLD